MQKTLFARHKLYKHTVRHYRFHGRRVDFACFGHSSDTSNLFQSGFDRVAVGSSNFYDTHFALFFDRDGSSRLGLYALYYLTLRSYYRTDKLFGYGDDFYPRHVWFEVGTRFGNSFRDFAQDVHTSFVSLTQSVLEYLVRQAVDLYIHLCGGDTIACTRYFEVHIAQMVFVAEYIGQYGIVLTLVFGYQPHSYSRYGFRYRYSCVH